MPCVSLEMRVLSLLARRRHTFVRRKMFIIIGNLREYRDSKTQTKRFQDALEYFDLNLPEGDPILVRAQRDLHASQRDDSLEDLQAFDALQNSRELGLDLESLEALPTRLIEARVAAGLTQKALADQSGVSPQQVQRDEATNNRNANFSRMLEVARVLETFNHMI
jgi:DNA-binding XRE family transcriptional regulator